MLSPDEAARIEKEQMTHWTIARNWDVYMKLFPMRDPSFATKRYLRGEIPESVAVALRDSISAAPVIEINNESIAQGVVIASLNPNDVKLLNMEHRYRDMTTEVAKALAAAFEVLAQPISHALNGAWRVLNCRSWTTLPGAAHGPNAWHVDGDLDDLMKMMIYATPTGWGQGGIQVETEKDKVLNVQGRAGQWVLFYNSILKHRAIAPENAGFERVATEVTIAPSFGFDLRPKFIGLVGRYHAMPHA
jgi:hypothetical protein